MNGMATVWVNTRNRFLTRKNTASVYARRSAQFYNVRCDFGSPYPWRMDEPQVAFL